VAQAPGEWNHNVHYHRLVFDALPARCESALDVGCGTGRLTRELRRVVPSVTGVDRDERCIAAARARAGAEGGADGLEYRCGDFLDLPLPAGGYDLVTAVASVHHVDTEAALRRMRDLLRPGGVLVVIGLARDSTPLDLVRLVPATVHHRVQSLRHRFRPGPGGLITDGVKVPVVWPPALTYRQVRRLARTLLPGMRFRRHLLWRYSIRWRKPG
jgi:2-polyprenyl-3-methyl-5-hydroxy-6-metoxy-1,4-benzoquinol methylase